MAGAVTSPGIPAAASIMHPIQAVRARFSHGVRAAAAQAGETRMLEF